MKILIFTKNWLGDVLFEVPAMQAIRENFPGARLVVLAPARCQEVLEALPYLDEVRIFDERKTERSLLSKIRLIGWLRRERFDKVYLFHRSFTRALLAWMGGIPERVGYETPKRRRVLTVAVPEPAHSLHQVDYFLVLLKWAGLRVKFGAEYQFFYGPDDELKALHLLESLGLQEKAFVAFHIGANWEPKKWPAGHFARLADFISETYGCPIVLTGTSMDESIAEEIINKTQLSGPPSFSSPRQTGGGLRWGGLISLCSRTSLGMLGALYKRAAFVVSSDSGPLHIASGVGTPVVALFGPTSPELTGPRGTGKKVVLRWVPPGSPVPWKEKTMPPEGWMGNISPETVFQRIQEENLWPEKREKISLLSR